MRPLVLRLGISLLSVSVLLLLTWPLLLSAVPVRLSSSPGNMPTQSGLITDTRWLELIRSGAPGSQLSRSAAAPPTLNLHVIDNLIAGRASSPAPISIVVWRSNSLIVSASATPYPEGANYFYAAQFYPSYTALGGGGVQSTLRPGDVISLTQAGTSFTMTVPSLTARVDAPTDRVFGAAPASEVVTTYLYPFADSAEPYTQTVSVDAGGYYQADYAGMLDVRPRDSGYVAYSEAPGRTTYVRGVAPFLRAQVDGSEISGLAAPLSSVMITVTDASHNLRSSWNSYSKADGSFEPYFQYSEIKLKPGDRITATSAGQTFSMTVLTLTAHIDLVNQRVWGDAPVDQALDLLRFDGPLCCSSNPFWNDLPAEQIAVTATITGQYSATLALTRPNYGAAIATAPNGNQTYARFAAPYLAARMGSFSSYWMPQRLTGQVNDFSTPMTITVQGPSGYFKDVQSVTAASDGYFTGYGGNGLIFDTADVITVTTAQGVQAALQLPLLTGQIDPVTDIVSGTAPPGAQLTLSIYDYGTIIARSASILSPSVVAGGGPPPNLYTISVTATTQGDYLVNLHSVLDLDNSSIGEVGLTTAEGHYVLRVLSLSRQEGCNYHPSLIHVGSNQVDFGPSLRGCDQYTYGSVRLRHPGGHLKAEQALPVGPWYLDLSIHFYAGTQPTAIEVGDFIEVEWYNSSQFVPTPWPVAPTAARSAFRSAADTHLITVVVPTLTVQLDPAANLISGQAPASTMVALNLYRDQRQLGTFSAVVDTQGFYAVSLAVDVDVEVGDIAHVTYTPIEPPAFSARGVLPMLRVQLHQTSVEGVLPPLSVYTATLQTTPPITTVYRGTVSNEGYFSFGIVPIRPGDSVMVTTVQHVLQLNVPSLTAHVDRASATVFGQAPLLARLRVAPYNNYGISQDVTATVTGTYRAAFPGLAPLNTTYGKLTYFDAEGDQALLSFATVHWDIVVNDKCLSGIIDTAPVTLTLRANAGNIKSTLLFTPTYPSYSACFTATVQSGDQIFLQTASATEIFTVPLLTARHHYTLQAVEGIAPPNHDLYADLSWSSSAYRHTYSDASGHYGVDISDLRPSLLSRGRVYLHDEAGNTTSIYFTVTGHQTFLPIMRR